MEQKIHKLLLRFEEIEKALSDPAVLSDKKRYKELNREYAYLSELRKLYFSYKKTCHTLQSNRDLLQEEGDPELIEIIRGEITALEMEEAQLCAQIKTLLVPPNPHDHANVILELRAGTGGDEAAIFVGDCARMYRLFSDRMQWKFDPLSCADSLAGGYKEYIVSITGKNVHLYLQYEAGTHRVQRVPITETQGRVHTSAITVAVLMEPEEEEEIEVDEADLKIETQRSSGSGGQHVNTTDSAVRITHMPTGIVVYCQQERSQHKNKDKAMRILVAKLAAEKESKKHEERASIRAHQVGSGDRSAKIRTYNYPQNRVTDHRIPLTLYKLDQIMEGKLEEISQPLIHHFHQEELNE